jgi:8-oxo-dGTP diphosphatase
VGGVTRGGVLAPRAVDFAHVCHHNSDTDRLAFFFTALRWQGRPVNAEPHEHDRLDWFAVDDPPGELLACAAHGLRHYRQGSAFSLLNWRSH